MDLEKCKELDKILTVYFENNEWTTRQIYAFLNTWSLELMKKMGVSLDKLNELQEINKQLYTELLKKERK